MSAPNTAVLVTGSRGVDRRKWEIVVEEELERERKASERLVIIHGDCPDPVYLQPVPRPQASIDQIAQRYAEGYRNDPRINVLKFPANWGLGAKGGPIRNELMVNLLDGFNHAGWEVRVLAFHPYLAQSKGTGGCVRYARQKGLDVWHFDGHDQHLMKAVKA